MCISGFSTFSAAFSGGPLEPLGHADPICSRPDIPLLLAAAPLKQAMQEEQNLRSHLFSAAFSGGPIEAWVVFE